MEEKKKEEEEKERLKKNQLFFDKVFDAPLSLRRLGKKLNEN